MKIRLVFPEIGPTSQILEKMPYLAMLKKTSKNFSDSRSGSGLLPKFNQFFLVHRYISGKIFTKIRPVVFT